MNIYDFDGTIIYGDSEQHFFKYLLDNNLLTKRKAKTLAKFLYLENNKKLSFLITRPHIYKSLSCLSNIEEVLEDFWDKHEHLIKPFYKKIQKEDDLISSATPDFILKPIMRRLNIKYYICTHFNLKRFKTVGRFNWKQEKVNRLYKEYPNVKIDNFYSDSLGDKYLARLATHAYLVKDDEIKEWSKKEME